MQFRHHAFHLSADVKRIGEEEGILLFELGTQTACAIA